MHKDDPKRKSKEPGQNLAEQSEAAFQDAVNKLRDKQELGTFETNYDSMAKTPTGFGEVSYGAKAYTDDISQDEIDSVVDPTEGDD